IGLLVIYLWSGDILISRLFLFGVVAMGFDCISDFLKPYFWAILLGFLTVVAFSLIGLLAIHDDFGSLVLGFRNPNTPAVFGLVIFLLIFVLFDLSKTKLTFFFIATLLLSVLVQNNSVSILLVLLPIFNKIANKKLKLEKKIISLIPIILLF